MIKLDPLCKSYVLSYLSKHEGKTFYKAFKDGTITKDEYADKLNDLYDTLISKNIPTVVATMLKDQPSYSFNVDKALSHLTDTVTAFCITEPYIVFTVDGDDTYFHLVSRPRKDDTIIKYLTFSIESYEDFLIACKARHYYTAGFNWLKDKQDSPTVLLYGNTKDDVLKLKQKMEDDKWTL